MLVTLLLMSEPLKNQTVPLGMLGFQLAGDATTARAILASWDDDTRLLVSFSLGFDYVFLLAYPAFLAAACSFVAGPLRRRGLVRGAALAAPVAWLQLGAGAADAVENAALLQELRGSGLEALPAVAAGAASVKFAGIVVGFVFLAVAGALCRLRRVAPT